MGLILDLAVAALALAVVTSLALLAWTLAISAVRAVQAGRSRVAGLRQAVTDADARIAPAGTALTDLIRRATPSNGDRSNR